MPEPEIPDLLTALQRSVERARAAQRDWPVGQEGWCKNADHDDDGDSHFYRPTCVGFVSESEHTAEMLREAEEYDRNASGSGAEARYIEQHRPY